MTVRTDKPITLRAPGAVRDVIRAAARATGETVTDFMLEAALERVRGLTDFDLLHDAGLEAHELHAAAARADEALREKGLR